MWEASLQSGGCKGTGSLDHSLTEAPEVGTKHPWRGGGIWQPWDAHCNRAGSSVYFFKTKLKITTQNI